MIAAEHILMLLNMVLMVIVLGLAATATSIRIHTSPPANYRRRFSF